MAIVDYSHSMTVIDGLPRRVSPWQRLDRQARRMGGGGGDLGAE